MSYVVTNFAYGTGPYLRTTELAIAFNNECQRRGQARLSIIVPLVYGEKQKAVLLEEFSEHAQSYPNEILLDRNLGSILKSVFYTGKAPYKETLRDWVSSATAMSRDAHQHLTSRFEVENLFGEKQIINGQDIVLEINRSPRIRFDVAPSYSTTFGYVADILEQALKVGKAVIDIDEELLKQGIDLADSIEGKQDLHLMAYPATFSWSEAKCKPRYSGEILVPPITDLPRPSIKTLDKGIFVTITGIEGLERLYAEVDTLGLKLYSNDRTAVPTAEIVFPHEIANPAIVFQFARAGWGSIWLSMFLGTPLLVPAFDPTDDPEIYFNNQALLGLGIGLVYEGQPLVDILNSGTTVQAAQKQLTAKIFARFGNLNGNEVAAKIFADKFLSVASEN